MSKPAKLTSAWRLIRQSLSDYRGHWAMYMLIVAIVAIPFNLMSLNQAFDNDPGFRAYSAIAHLFMNAAVLTAIFYYGAGKSFRASDAYYDGSAVLLKFLLISVVLVLAAAPLLIGLLMLIITVVPVAGSAVSSLPEMIGIGMVIVIFALLSGWLLTRYMLALPAAVEDGLRPLAALRRARRLTLGRFWQIFGRLVAILPLLILAGLAIYLPFYLLSLVLPDYARPLFIIYQIFATILVLPFANLYLFKLYRALKPAE